jgi:PmbA protein
VRCDVVEQLKEAGSKAVGLRVFMGQQVASAYSSDFSPQGIQRLVASALAAARVTSEDPAAGLPDPAQVGQIATDLQLYSDDVMDLEAPALIDAARRAERAAFAFDPRIRNSEGASCDASYGRKILANSQGFVGEYRRSSCSLSVVPIAVPEPNGDAGGRGMQQDYWYSVARGFSGLEPPEEIGRIAAQRALRRLGARKVSTARVPVVFDQRTARSLLASLAEALNGDSIYRNASFLAGKLGEKVASDAVTIIDDGTLPGGFGSSPFDDEGVRTRRTVVIERGVLKSYLLNSYTARKLGLVTTGNAARGLTGNPAVSANNFFLQPGEASPEQIIRSVANGFYVTHFMGFGVNGVTGDVSLGAAGLWIDGGEPAYPVEEVTVAGNLLEMLQAIRTVGADLEFRGSMASPTFLVEAMTVAGR